jgi:sterol desaturase/sphingolipid hydroxylase (fatty acid hydroxylase superfamily)
MYLGSLTDIKFFYRNIPQQFRFYHVWNGNTTTTTERGVLTHLWFITSVWYTVTLSVLMGICSLFAVPVTRGLIIYLIFQDLWFYLYHRVGHYFLEHYPSGPLLRLHLSHHDARTRPEWLAYVLVYLPIELMGCVLYIYLTAVSPAVVVSLCVLHTWIHSLTIENTTNTSICRMIRYHTCHHEGRSAKSSFSAASLLGDLMFGTVPPPARWY